MRKMCKAMFWMDLGLGGLLMWGAVTGYQTGWKESAGRLGGLICTTLIALPVMTGLRLLWSRHFPIEETIRAIVTSRLALPVSGTSSGKVLSSCLGLPHFLSETLNSGAILTTSASWRSPAEMLAQMLGCTAAFLAGFCFWWGFFALCGSFVAEKGESKLGQSARWAGALTGLIRQCCKIVLLTGIAAPLAWLCGVPPDLLELEKSLLARWAWQIFGCLGIWH